MTKRMLMALLALIGVLLASYLALYKLGYIGTLVCGTGSCETVQLSRWATLLKIPVAVWGVGYYLTLLAVTVVGTHDRFADDRRGSLALVWLTGWGVLFSGWLTWLELFRIHAICKFCVGSASIVVALFALAVMDLREAGRG